MATLTVQRELPQSIPTQEKLFKSRCQKLEVELAQDHTSITQYRQTIQKLEEALEQSSGRGRSLEEELNAAIAEKIKLQEKTSELDSVRMELEAKVSELESRLSGMEGEKAESENPVHPSPPPSSPPVRVIKDLHYPLPSSSSSSTVPPFPSPPPSSSSSRKRYVEMESAQIKDVHSILVELESYQVSTPRHVTTRSDSLDKARSSAKSYVSRPQDTPTKSSLFEQDSLERSGHTPDTPLLNQSLAGLRHAYNLINTLGSININLQDKVTSLTREIKVSHMTVT